MAFTPTYSMATATASTLLKKLPRSCWMAFPKFWLLSDSLLNKV